MAKGYSDVLIGLQYGDEGKARVIDVIGSSYDIIARFNGGANAGHTVSTKKGKLVLHQIPSGVFYPKKILYIGSGCVVNLLKLAQEIEDVQRLGISLSGRLHISDQASLIQPHHILIDELIGKSIGTTKNGIGPAYADRALRIYKKRVLNIRLGDILGSEEVVFAKIAENLKRAAEHYGIPLRNTSATIKELQQAFDKIKPYIQTDSLFLTKQVEKGKTVLFEGAQSFMLDVARGTVPFVTSSNTMAGSAYVGGDLSPKFHRKTIGVAKMIMSRVGNGPFTSELGGETSEKYCMEKEGSAHSKQQEAKSDPTKLLASKDPFEIGKALRILGDEYGASTGRPRRIGFLDLVQLRFAIRCNGVDQLWLNKCDCLSDFSKSSYQGVPMVVGYSLSGKEIDYVPSSNDQARKVKPVVKVYPAFSESIQQAKKYGQLPKQAQKLLSDIAKYTGCSFLGIGVGSRRDQYIAM